MQQEIDEKQEQELETLNQCVKEDTSLNECAQSAGSVKETLPKGMKWTKQRKDVYQVLIHATQPLSAVQIYHQINKTEETANYAVSTIYRILTAFEEKGFVTKSNWMGDGTLVYEWNKGGHTHYAVCLNCHKRIPLEACPFEHIHHSREEDGLDASGFQVTGHKLELYGYCKQCQK